MIEMVELIKKTLDTKEKFEALHVNKISSLSKSLKYMRVFLDNNTYADYEKWVTDIYKEKFGHKDAN